MYVRSQLGQGADFGRQAGSMAASFAAKTAATYAVTAFAPAAFGSAAGPIGTVVGAIVSFLMSLFGGKVKDPVFGIVALIPESDNQKITVGRMLAMLKKPVFDLGYTWGIRDENKRTALGAEVKALLDRLPQGALAISSGGLPTSHPQVAKIDFSKLQSFTIKITAPFTEILALLTDQARAMILTAPLPYIASKSYYYQIGEARGEVKAGSKSKWAKAGISQAYDAVKISGGHALGKSMEKAWKSIPQNINGAFIKHAGIDVLSGAIVNQPLATQAFKPASQTAALPANLGWLAILLGGLLLL
jgi:hypothetical protein